MAIILADLPYAYDSLDPYMSAETLKFHHDKHHNAYVVKANELIVGTEFENLSVEEIMVKSFSANPGLFNQAAQSFNHEMFWNSMKPPSESAKGNGIPGNLEQKIIDDLGGVEKLRADFIAKGMGQFGSGWVWLAIDNTSGKLEILNTANAENPVVFGKTPILVCDVWEHSYYIDYRNARPKYLEAWFDNLANWDYATQLLEKAPLKIAA